MIVIDPPAYIEMREGISLEARGFWLDLLTLCNGHDSIPDNDQSISTLLNLDPRVVRRLKAELIKAGVLRAHLGVKGGA